jgi:hypothetical protein
MESIIMHFSAPIASAALLIFTVLALALALVHASGPRRLRPARVAPRRAAPAPRR